jgi:hypothetical protein
VFTDRFIVRVKDLILIELDVANRNDLVILWDLDSINITILIINEVSDICSWSGFVGHSVLVCQDLVSDWIGSTAISVDVCSVWLVY